VKTAVYGSLTDLGWNDVLVGIAMGTAMVAGTFLANSLIRNVEKGKFRKYVAVLLLLVGVYMAVHGA